jgi:hypothetical protein
LDVVVRRHDKVWQQRLRGISPVSVSIGAQFAYDSVIWFVAAQLDYALMRSGRYARPWA